MTAPAWEGSVKRSLHRRKTQEGRASPAPTRAESPRTQAEACATGRARPPEGARYNLVVQWRCEFFSDKTSENASGNWCACLGRYGLGGGAGEASGWGECSRDGAGAEERK